LLILQVLVNSSLCAQYWGYGSFPSKYRQCDNVFSNYM